MTPETTKTIFYIIALILILYFKVFGKRLELTKNDDNKL